MFLFFFSFVCCFVFFVFFFKQKTAYEMRISDWSSDVCSSDLTIMLFRRTALAFAITCALSAQEFAGEAEAQKWIDNDFQPSTLSKDQQLAEMTWFIEAANKLKEQGVDELSVVYEHITTNEYESTTLTKPFTELTGIKVHQ